MLSFDVISYSHRSHYTRQPQSTAIISVYSISRVVFVIETACVVCAVRAEFLGVLLRRTSAEQLGFDPGPVIVGFVVNKWVTIPFFLRVLRFTHYSSLITRSCGRRLITLKEKQCCWGCQGSSGQTVRGLSFQSLPMVVTTVRQYTTAFRKLHALCPLYVVTPASCAACSCVSSSMSFLRA